MRATGHWYHRHPCLSWPVARGEEGTLKRELKRVAGAGTLSRTLSRTRFDSILVRDYSYRTAMDTIGRKGRLCHPEAAATGGDARCTAAASPYTPSPVGETPTTPRIHKVSLSARSHEVTKT